MARNLLTEKEIKNAKPREKDYRLLDGDGLFVFVARTGGKSFQYRYKLNGKPDTVTLKEASTLAEARSAVEPLRKLVAAGTDPKIARKVERARNATAQAQTFAAIAADWVQAETRRKKWSDGYFDEVRQSLRNHLSALDPLPVSAVLASITSPLLQRMEVNATMMQEKVERRLHGSWTTLSRSAR
jgi:hypothetical protein